MALRLEFGTMVIRTFSPDDEDALCKYADNRAVSGTLRDRFPFPYTREAARQWIRQTLQDEPVTHFAIAEKELIGSIGYIPQEDVFRKTVEIGYWVAEPFWGRGIATRALGLLTEHLLTDGGYVRVQAGVFESNPASMRVLEKAGFGFEGRLRHAVYKNNQLQDLLMYAVTRPENLTGGSPV